MRNDYWVKPSDWPRETRGHIPMAKAVLEIGASTLPGWTGNEAIDEFSLTPGLKPYFQATEHDMRQAHDILISSKDKDYIPTPRVVEFPPEFNDVLRSGFERTVFELNMKDYDSAQYLIPLKNEKFIGGAIRFIKSKKLFLHAATMNKFKTSVRLKDSFKMVELEAEIWSIVREEYIFAKCCLNPNEPYSTSSGGTDFLPIMVDRPTFESWLDARIGGHVTVSADPNSSENSAGQPSPLMLAKGGRLADGRNEGVRESNRSPYHPMGPLNPDVQKAIAVSTATLRAEKAATEAVVRAAIAAADCDISGRTFRMLVIKPAREAADAPAVRGPRSRKQPL